MRAHDQMPDATQSQRSTPVVARKSEAVEPAVAARAAMGGVGSAREILALQSSAGNAAVTHTATAQARGGTVQRASGGSSDTAQEITREEAFGSWLRGQKGHVASAFRSGYLKLKHFHGKDGDEALLVAANPRGAAGSKWRSMSEAEFNHLEQTNALPQPPHYGGLSPTREYAAKPVYFGPDKGRRLVQFLVEDADEGRTYGDVMKNGNVGGKADGPVMSHGLGLRATPAASGGIRTEQVPRPDGTMETQSTALKQFNDNLEAGQFHWFLDSAYVTVPPHLLKYPAKS